MIVCVLPMATESAPAAPAQVASDGNSVATPPQAAACEFPSAFPSPVRSYDVHIYFFHTDPRNSEIAANLREEIIRVFPHLTVYRFWDRPIGPHPIGMFEIDLKTPLHFFEFVPWLQMHRNGLSALVHPNTGFPLMDHTVNAMWIGEKQVLNTRCLKERSETYGL